jgi:hypothetical protein
MYLLKSVPLGGVDGNGDGNPVLLLRRGRMADGTLKVTGVIQDPSDPRGQSFTLHFNRNFTHAERETVATHLSLHFLPTEVNGPDTAVIRQAHAAYFVDPNLRKRIKTAVALAEAQAVKNLAFENQREGEAAALADRERRQLEAIDWDDDSDDESQSKGAD